MKRLDYLNVLVIVSSTSRADRPRYPTHHTLYLYLTYLVHHHQQLSLCFVSHDRTSRRYDTPYGDVTIHISLGRGCMLRCNLIFLCRHGFIGLHIRVPRDEVGNSLGQLLEYQRFLDCYGLGTALEARENLLSSVLVRSCR